MQSRQMAPGENGAPGRVLTLLASTGVDDSRPVVTADDPERDEIARAKRSPAAFAPLYERYVDAVYTYCVRRIGDPEAASDLTAQVFTRALAALPRFRDDAGSFRSWLFAIAHNTVIDTYRRARDHASLDAGDHPIGLALVHPGNGPEAIVLQRDLRDAFQAAMALLTGAQRELVALRLAGLTGPEIARAMDITIPAMKSTQYRAYARLRDLLAPYADESSAGKEHDHE